MKKLILSALIFLFSSGMALACHQGDNQQLRGHKSKLPFGVFISSEASTAKTSTSTNCKWYASVLDQQYYRVAESAAQGAGEFINLIADSHGCAPEVHAFFGAEIKARHAQIFDAVSEREPQILMKRFQGIINDDPLLSNFCGPGV